LETAAARVPFSTLFFQSLMTEEDIVNLRTFQRLMLLLSGTRRKEDINTVRFVVYTKRTTFMHYYNIIIYALFFFLYVSYMSTILVEAH
jgi:hypothetical protein